MTKKIKHSMPKLYYPADTSQYTKIYLCLSPTSKISEDDINLNGNGIKIRKYNTNEDYLDTTTESFISKYQCYTLSIPNKLIIEQNGNLEFKINFSEPKIEYTIKMHFQKNSLTDSFNIGFSPPLVADDYKALSGKTKKFICLTKFQEKTVQ